MHKLTVLAPLSFLLAVAGCARGAERVAGSQLALSLESVSPLRDEPAGQQAADLKEAFQSGKQSRVSIGIYELEDVGVVQGTLRARGAALGIDGQEDAVPGGNRFGLTAGAYRLVRNGVSGAEFFGDMNRFHRGAGVPETSLLAQSNYISAARSYVAKVFPAPEAGVSLYPYKVWTYMNAHGEAQGKPTAVEAYQVAVCFNTAIDGIPVIGSGGKLVVHMTPSGEVIAHESTRRVLRARTATVTGADLLSPDEARAQAEARVTARGAKLADYRLIREELGYFARGRDGAQTVLAPHYAYIYEPMQGVVGRKIVEILPAVVRADVSALVTADEARDQARLATAAAIAPGPGVK